MVRPVDGEAEAVGELAGDAVAMRIVWVLRNSSTALNWVFQTSLHSQQCRKSR
jgi:hypothetical protein